ncbi:MAG TPA: SAM-dependent chlorinase/fluorinase [Thermoplasmata archaeon]|nr:SAM-dependent chlorinase/fluorinase [Thermoplasmata archaeon]
MARPLVTLTTDIGAAYAAQIRAVLLRRVPGAQIVDLIVDLTPHGVGEAAFLLDHLARGFPAGTIHLAVVDPGVGSRRRPLAVRTREGSSLVGPDNGLLDPLARRWGVRTAVRLQRHRFAAGPRVGATFDGRDLFAPAVAALLEGHALPSLGPRVAYRPRAPRPPVRTPDGARGRVAHVDRFGNLITDLPSGWAPARAGTSEIRLGAAPWRPIARVRHYAALPPGGVGVLPSSFGTLEIAVREGRGSERLGAAVGDPVGLRWRVRRAPRAKRNYRAEVR